MSPRCGTPGCRSSAMSAGLCLFCRSGDVRPDLDSQGNKRDPNRVAAAVRRASGAMNKPRTPRARARKPTVTTPAP